MDPDACLRELLELAAQIIRAADEDDDAQEDDHIAQLASELAERAQALDQWLHTGGFLPRRWRGQDGARA